VPVSLRMPVHRSGRALLRRLGVVLALTTALGVLPQAASAASPPSSARSFGIRATSVASDYKGTPYRAGGTTPRGFDCSGFTQFVYARLGTKVPRVSQAQYDRSHKVGKHVRPGDLIFFYRTGTREIYHVGIYAGDHRIWHAPHSGALVRLERLWTSSWTGGRY
jgi:cell wall-associated NlpC family hydrolase